MEKAKENYDLIDGLGGQFQFSDILISCWISFEAFTCLKYNLEYTRRRINRFCKEFRDMYAQEFDEFAGDFRRHLIQLAACEITDMRPNHRRDPTIKINDIRKLEDVMEVIYRVRNNLFHGGKDIEKEGDRIIIQCSAVVFFRILEKFLIGQGYLDW